MKLTFGERIGQLARSHPDETALVFIEEAGRERVVTWEELERRSNGVAYLLSNRNVEPESIVAIQLPNSVEHYLACIGAWKLGACVLPLSWRLPQAETDRLLALANPTVTIGGDPNGPDHIRQSTIASVEATTAPPSVVAQPWKAIASGGSTGIPKLIIDLDPLAGTPGHFIRTYGETVGMRPSQVQLVCGPLYHNTPFCWGFWGLFEDHQVVLLERFTPETAVSAINRHGVQFATLVPTMMHRIMRADLLQPARFESIEAVWHTASPCPPTVKRAWIDALGPSRLIEAYGSTEGVGGTVIRGDEWLLHPGSVGRPTDCEMLILDEDNRVCPPGEVGEIHMRPHSPAHGYSYIGSPRARTTMDGFVSVGDLGWLDEDGYLYYADRRSDLVITGGANVYPAEVEAALLSHPEVADVAVIGLPDPDWGRRLHAVVLASDISEPLTQHRLADHLRPMIAAYKIPKSFEFVSSLPRDESGKLRRSALIDERTVGDPA